MRHTFKTLIFSFSLILSSLHAGALNICVTVPELKDLASVIGGSEVEVTSFVKGQEDPHSLVAKPSDVLKLSKADAFLLLGMGMEVGWAPALVNRARNVDLKEGKPGYIDTSVAVEPIHDSPSNVITRALGDVHPEGNPHYMLDPVNGLNVARLIAERFSKLKPGLAQYFSKNLKSFEKDWANRAFGKKLAERYPLDKLIQIQAVGKLTDFLKQTGEFNLLSGWFGEMASLKGTELVADHSQWPYFSKRFGIKIERFLEPKPGIPPSAKYLKNMVEWINAEKIPGVLSSTYFSPRHLEFVKSNSQCQILPTAHQMNSRKQANTYLNMIDYNVKLICACCKNS